MRILLCTTWLQTSNKGWSPRTWLLKLYYDRLCRIGKQVGFGSRWTHFTKRDEGKLSGRPWYVGKKKSDSSAAVLWAVLNVEVMLK